MKKFILILIASIGMSLYLSAQSIGDYSSIGSGNWNDPTKWQIFNGSSWVSTTTYPGQNPGTGKVTIITETEIKITETVPHPVTTLYVGIDDLNILPPGLLTFSAETAVSLMVSGDVIITGELRIDNQNGAKTHELFIGRNFSASQRYDPNCGCYNGGFDPINQDDKLGVVFNTADPYSVIEGTGISFHDITFNGTGILVNTNIAIAGTATFINGIVRPGMKTVTNGMDILEVFDIGFFDGAMVSGGSNASYIEGAASKWGIEPFTFPMGHEGFYAPLTISGIVQPEKFYAMYYRNGDGNMFTISDPELFSISNCESWSLIRDINNPVNSSINVTIGWSSGSAIRCGSSSYISNVSDVVLTTGFSHGGTGTGTTANGSVTWSGYNHLDDWYSLTLGNVGTSCRIPFGLNSANITSNSATVSWSAEPGAVSYDVEYYSNSWINAATGTTSTSVNLSGLSPSVIYGWRVRANCGSASSSYRQSQFTTAPPPPPPVCNDIYETNNGSSQARAISLGNTISAAISSASDVDWFKVTMPNNSNTNLEVTLSNLPADYDLYVYNKNLQLVGSSVTTGTSNEVVIYNSNARKATYFIKVLGKNGAFNTSYCYSLLAQVSSGARSASGKSYPANEVTDVSDKQFLYPNPASEFVYLNFNSATEGLVNMQIVNSIGQLVKQHPVNTIKGYNQIKIQVADIRPGMYILKINKGDLNLTRKFVIAR